jgi:predicted lipoprotein
MTDIVTPAPKAPGRSRRGMLIAIGIAVLVVAAIAADTKIVRIGSSADVQAQVFSPDSFGDKQFPRIQAFVESHAVEGPALAAALAADKAGAAKKYGTPSSVGTIMPVKLTAVAGQATAGVYDLTVAGMPPDIHLRVQMGPAINGTELRDAPGDIAFGDFKNQIEYQNAGSAINRAMKKAVLAPVDTGSLTGKTLDIVGVFRLINPKNWLITPVAVTVK